MLIRNDGGKVYRYVGAPSLGLDMGTTVLTNPLLWVHVDPTKSTYDDLAALGLTNVTAADATAAAGAAARNDVRGGAFAWIENETVTAGGGISVSALETATIRATGDVVAEAHGGSLVANENDNKGMAFQIATNVMLSGAEATVTDSVLTANGGDVVVAAENTSTLEALMSTHVFSPQLAIGVTLAFNSIGWDSQNILFKLVDAIAGTSIGDENPARTIASVTRTTITASGAISVTATSHASIVATVDSAATTFQASLTSNASAVGVDVVVAMNRLSTQVQASIDDSPSAIANGGSVEVVASDDASITSVVVAPVLAVAVSLDDSTAVAVALSIARNEISTDTSAAITNVPTVTATGGNVTVSATQSSAIDATSTASAVTVADSLS
jgi:hypothetical protein